MKTITRNVVLAAAAALILGLGMGTAQAFFGGKFKALKPENGNLRIPAKDLSDGKARYFKVRSEKGIMVKFFVVQSHDGVIRAAVDACDICYRSGKGYRQDGDVMVCANCGMRFATDRINEVKGGCNPAPLNRQVQGDILLISMEQINTNAWYCEFKR